MVGTIQIHIKRKTWEKLQKLKLKPSESFASVVDRMYYVYNGDLKRKGDVK